MSDLRVGVVGCGLVSRLLHLPHLVRTPHARVTHICDRDPLRRDRAAATTGARPVEDAGDLFAAPLDAVVIATEDLSHEALVLQALAANLHVFVEKPLTLDPDSAARLVAAAERAGRVLVVGYQRRWDPAVAAAREALAAAGTVRHAHIHDFCHDNRLVYGAVAPELLEPDFAAGVTDYGGADRWREIVRARFGEHVAPRAATYRLFVNLCCHDVGVLIDVLGEPERVLFADLSHDLAGTAVFGYQGHHVTLEMAQCSGARFDQVLQAVTDDEIVRVRWPSPFVEHAAATLEVLGSAGERQTLTATRFEPRSRFALEIDHFVRAALAGTDESGSARHALAVARWVDEVLALDARQT